MKIRLTDLFRLVGVLNGVPWLVELIAELLRGRKATEVLVTAVLMPHAARVAEMTGLSEAQVREVYAATGERIG